MTAWTVAIPGRVPASTKVMISRSTIEASPRGPNQPITRTVVRLSPVPMRETATGIMRIRVRLSTA